jgi:hypothetical protein
MNASRRDGERPAAPGLRVLGVWYKPPDRNVQMFGEGHARSL